MQISSTPCFIQAPGSFTVHSMVRRTAAFGLIAGALALAACGGGGGSGDAGGGSNPGPAHGALAAPGTYTLTTGGVVKGSFMLDPNGVIAVCTVGADRSCTAKVTPPTAPGGSTAFALQGSASGASASGAIAANGSVSAQLTAANGAVTPLAGSKVSDSYVECAEPFTRKDGQCLPPASAAVVIAPVIVWQEELIPLGGGRIYTMQLCYGGLGGSCQDISPRIKVTAEDLADEDTPPIMAYAESVAKEFQNIIQRLWAAKTYPKQLAQIFRKAVQGAIDSETPNAVETALSDLKAAGFPAAAPGGQSSGPSGTAPTAASACGEQPYPGGNSTDNLQVDSFDRQAQSIICLYKATGEQKLVDNGNKVCGILDGLLKVTPGKFTPLFCVGSKLKL